MLIEISGANFSNKGAHLMLAAVCARLRSSIPNVRLTMPFSNEPFERRAEYQLYYTLRAPNRWRPRRLAQDVLINIIGRTPLNRTIGIVKEGEIDCILDISGYAFGDKWPPQKTARFASRAEACNRRTKPVIMLPQMLGPFTKRSQSHVFTKLSQFVDLIYARDRESFECALPIVVDPRRLRVSPDITISTPARPVTRPAGEYACLIPNSKLLEPNPQQQHWQGAYVRKLLMAAEQLLSRKFTVVIVQHEHNSGDRQLVSQLAERIGRTRCFIFQSHDPQVIKGFLGGATLVIGSRFHGLVSALSMAVPVIALGWAHKYDMLLSDFGVPDAIHFANSPDSHLLSLIDSAVCNQVSIAAVLERNKLRLEAKIDAMWSDVLAVVRRA